MSITAEQQTLRVAISKGTHLQPFASVLARQRTEEPFVKIDILETSIAQQAKGLKEGIYDVGLTLWHDGDSQLNAHPLWYDALAIAVPKNSSLSSYTEIPVIQALFEPIILWRSDACEAMLHHIEQLIASADTTPHVVQYVERFDVMTTLVAAGYGISFAPSSRITSARDAGIVMRPLAERAPNLTTYLLTPDTLYSGAAERFVRRLIETNDSVRQSNDAEHDIMYC